MQTSDAAQKCQYCGTNIPHLGTCPSVKAMEYYPDGTLKRVELKTAHDYPPIVTSSPRDWLTGGKMPDAPAGTSGVNG